MSVATDAIDALILSTSGPQRYDETSTAFVMRMLFQEAYCRANEAVIKAESQHDMPRKDT